MALSLIVSCALGINWLLSGLVLNVLQAVAWLTVRPISKHHYRTINYYLTYSNWSQVVVLAEWLSGCRARIYYKGSRSLVVCVPIKCFVCR